MAKRMGNSFDYQAILDSAPDAMLVIDTRGIMRLANRQSECIFGYARDEMIGQPIEMLIPGEYRGHHPRLRESYMDAPATRSLAEGRELEALAKDGSILQMGISLSPIRSGGETFVVAALRDLTESKKAEREAAQAMQNAREIAEQANQAKSNFLANMSHEIRTPMNAIIGMNYLCLKTELTEKQAGYLLKVDQAAHSLLGIINDILDFSKIEAGKLSIESVSFRLEDLFDNLRNIIGLKADEKKLELLFDVRGDVPAQIVGDPLRLEQVLSNLAGNAVKFTETGDVVISVTRLPSPPATARLQFSVKDTGIGMSPEQQSRLFQPFTQADTTTTRRFGGTGLGLAISRDLVERMGGTIRVSSEAGSGSTFTFELEFSVVHEPVVAQELREKFLRGTRALVVDDNAASREILQQMLESFEFEVSVVSSGREAIAELHSASTTGQPYRLVLMDWMMPHMDGMEAMRAIRADGLLATIPTIIMTSAYNQDDALAKAGDSPPDDFLAKPVSPSTLLDSIIKLFDQEARSYARQASLTSSDSASAAKLSGARILLVEDHPLNQELAMEILRDAGLHVTLAEDGQAALNALEERAFDGVLMDIQMPVMDGYEATRRIRAQDRFRDLPVIAMTANAMAGDREKSLNAGMNDHIAKPIDVDSALAIMGKWITPSG